MREAEPAPHDVKIWGGPRVQRVQLRLATKLTCEDYINQQAWREAAVESCPWHPRGMCGFRSHTHYVRKDPAGLVIRRWYCAQAHQTVSLLPDFAAARISGTLTGIEDVAVQFEQALKCGATAGEAAQLLRPDIESQGALRWVRRRLQWVHAALVLLVGCAPELLTQGELTIRAVQNVLHTQQVLVQVREIAAPHLPFATAPVGFAPSRRLGNHRMSSVQHNLGPDPPT
jgi:hypothetical protein